jgi:hypothetical protein
MKKLFLESDMELMPIPLHQGHSPVRVEEE